MRELQLIARIRSGNGRSGSARNAGVRLGIGDDCAVLRVPAGHEMVVTTDFSLEGRHFRRDWHTAASAGHRCLARGLSDVAAMGAKPVAAFLSLALPRGFDLEWVDGFLSGLRGLAEQFGVELAGGDTAEAVGEQVLADIVVVGSVPAGEALLRSTARVGDRLYCTGRLGGAAVELAGMMAGSPANAATPGRQSFPAPRVEAGLALLGLATACIDLSDGLSTDLSHLCAASGVGAELESLPLAEGATLEQGLHGGEDYELLFASGGDVPGTLAGVEVTCIGRVVAGSGVLWRGTELKAGGWEHFGDVG